MEKGIQITSVVVLVLHILHKKEKRNTFPFSSESEATKTGLDKGRYYTFTSEFVEKILKEKDWKR